MRVSVNIRAAEAKLTKLGRALNHSAILDEIGRRLLQWAQHNVSLRGSEKKWRPFRMPGASGLQSLGGFAALSAGATR